MNSIIYELRANDIKEEDIQTIIERVQDRLSEESLDEELVRLGYPKIFTVDYDDYSENSDDDFDDY